MNCIDLFTNIYEEKRWGDNISIGFNGNSGGGSCINEINLNQYIPFITNFINKNKIESVVDIGCGDFRCGELIYKDINCLYTGYDVYKKMIDTHNKKFADNKNFNFIFADIINNPEELVKAELCIIKDVLQHISSEMIYKFMDYITSNKLFKYVLIINTSNQIFNNQTLSEPNTINSFRALSGKFLPLKKYNVDILYNYGEKDDPKEISLINILTKRRHKLKMFNF
tara:strand:- start:80 stop:757 length:678 start_codon:yes stop_codon:yes gene_type:complete